MDKVKISRAKKAQYRENHNRARRLKYHANKDWREKIVNRNRKRYREDNEVEMRRACKDTEVSSYGQRRKILIDGVEAKQISLTNGEIAEALGSYHKFVLHRWQRAGKFPRPTHTVIGDSINKVFTLTEAKRLVAVMREHQKEKVLLTVRDTETIEKLMQQ